MPYASTEQGVAMLSSVLRSPLAIQVNIGIIRAFVEFRRMASTLSLPNSSADIATNLVSEISSLNFINTCKIEIEHHAVTTDNVNVILDVV